MSKEKPAPATELREQEPVAWRVKVETKLRDGSVDVGYQLRNEKMSKHDEPLYTSPQPAQQEPVAWMTKTGSVWLCKASETDTPLYTSPPAQRTWVNATTWRGLTDEELSEVYNQADWDTVNGWEYERAIEAKLKEKNT